MIPVANVDCAYRVSGDSGLTGKTVEHILGKYYIQSLSSMIPPIVLNPSPYERVLDLCAAPGSKSSQISEMMEAKGTLVSNEPAPSRIRSLVHTLDRMSIPNMGVLQYKGEMLNRIYNNYFDKILVDAPCSALGILQKKDEVSDWWNIRQVEKIAELQFKLLVSALKMLKLGGTLVYSTCTLTIEENELLLHRFLKRYPAEIVEFNLPVKSQPGITSYKDEVLNPDILKAKRIVPWEINSEGFFIAKMIKTGDTEVNKELFIKSKNLELLPHSHKKIKKYLVNVGDKFGIEPHVLAEYQYLIKKNDIYFIDANWDVDNISPFQRVGIKFGNIDNKGEVRLHTNAAQVLDRNITGNIVFLNKNELIEYFEGKVIRKNIDEPGQKAIRFYDYTLGTGVAFNEGLKSQFPRSKRTQEIVVL